MKIKNIVRPAAITGLLLLIPLGATQFTNKVNWGPEDFVVMGALLFGTGLFIEFIGTKLKKPVYRIVAVAIVIGAFLLIWAELAVGIFGSPWAGS